MERINLQLLGVIIFPLAILVLLFSLGGAFAHQQAMRRMIGERDTLAVSAELNHRMSAMRGLAQRASENIDTPEETLESSDYLINVARHSHATKAFLQDMYENDSLTLQVIDNGEGFQGPGKPGRVCSLWSLWLIRSLRASGVNGASLYIKSEAGKGTQLTIQLPFQGKEMEVNK